MRELTTGDDFEDIKIWLNTNLKENKSFVACKDSIHNPKSKNEVSSKGLYFWFIHPNGYDKLNKIIPLESILENRFTKKINGIDYDLVYVGTAGVRNNKNGVNNGNLFERFKWHIKNNQTLNSLRNNTISTLRRTIIPLFSDDLFSNESQEKLNQLFKNYFHLYYLDYGTEFLDVKDLVKSDETILITKLKPIFNLKENDNTQNPNHITAEIQIRRIEIEKATKEALGYPLTKNNMNIKSENKINSNQETLNLSKNFKIIMICNSGKRINSDLKFPIDSELNYLNHKIKFSATSNHPIHQFKPDDLIPNQIKSWRNYIEENQYVDYIPYMSYQLYIPRYAEYVILYEILYERFKENLYILSAGWGLVNATYRLPEYDITFSNSKNNYNQRKYKDNSFYDFNQLNLESDEDIVFIGSDSYIKSFLNLTIGTRNRKIIYHYGNQPDYILPDNTFIYREYNTENYNTIPKRTWYLELAYKFADGLIP